MSKKLDPLAKLVARATEEAELWAYEVGERYSVGSPIEGLFLTALVMATKFGTHEYQSVHVYEKGRVFDPGLVNKLDPILHVEPQKQLTDWRVDFLVNVWAYGTEWGGVVRPPGWVQMIVECDGHDFHERTKEQAAKDRGRDRWAQEKGYTVFRFTGSELYRDPWGCAEQVINWAVQRCY